MTFSMLATAVAAADRSLLDYVVQSRQVGLLIIALSVFVTAVIIAQLFTIRVSRLAPDDHIENLDRLLSQHDIRGSIEYCQNEENRCLLTRVLGGALARCARSPFGNLELKSAIEEIGEQEVARLQRMTDIVGLVASIAPMLGLLGTVVGMVGAFDALTLSDGPAKPDQLAGNISQALVTTVLGLIVAIPATAMYTYLRNRIEALATDIGVGIEEMTAHLETASGDSASATPNPAPRPRPTGDRPA